MNLTFPGAERTMGCAVHQREMQKTDYHLGYHLLPPMPSVNSDIEDIDITLFVSPTPLTIQFGNAAVGLSS